MIPSYLYSNTFPTGSNYICNPPVTNTDIDQMFLVYNLEETKKTLLKDGWTLCGHDAIDQYPEGYDDWYALRKDNLNALITNNMDYYLKFYEATETAKKLNLLDKKDRIELFQKITGRSLKNPEKESEPKIEQIKWPNVTARDTEVVNILNRIGGWHGHQRTTGYII